MSNKLTIEELSPGVFHIRTKSQFDLCSTFMRVQEFYESPYSEIYNKYFTHEQYMDVCANGTSRSGEEEIKFTYLEDWAGFNVPGNVFNKWVKLFSKNYMWEREEELINLVQDKVGSTNKFYVIGTFTDYERDNQTIDHELSHAWYYLDTSYKRKMLAFVKKLPKTSQDTLTKHLKKEGYRASVIKDEIIAYLSTNAMIDTLEMFPNKKIPWNHIAEMQLAFSEVKEEKLNNDEGD